MKVLMLCLLLVGCGAAAKVEGDALDRVDVAAEQRRAQVEEDLQRALRERADDYRREIERINQMAEDLREKLKVRAKLMYCPNEYIYDC